ncbi:DUF3006 domain-containing protein [Chengkuizengella axinellae]|uniref:DUF3006 domain-containing protein n=1 Tax=Chengkuizengella axinellae TaxID=3064388 RepID=A0ABT9J5G8_9BACL|nr:DUF3006 domain-containing protein [Chengkuizengella sp. 2205SS18-9]MDP5276194.1 DUF3006 domain-containing protein [Chengkuizengella sp. 2205SS18-9]
MKGIVDRIEGEIYVIEVKGKTKDVEKSLVNKDVKVNDVVVFRNGEWSVDENETLRRSEKIAKLMNDVWDD